MGRRVLSQVHGDFYFMTQEEHTSVNPTAQQRKAGPKRAIGIDLDRAYQTLIEGFVEQHTKRVNEQSGNVKEE